MSLIRAIAKLNERRERETIFLPATYYLLDKSFDRLYFTNNVYPRATTCAKYNDKNDI